MSHINLPPKEGNPRIVLRDCKPTWILTCPKCGVRGEIDDDQLHGRVSTLCDCGFHETRDWFKEAQF